MRIADATVIVTGAASPIGRAIAQRFYAAGANLVLADIAAEGLAEIAALMPGARCVTADLAREADARMVIDAALAAGGRIDVLVNNAGGGIIAATLKHTPDTLRATIDRNLWTAIWCSWLTLPHMVEQDFGRIINIGADSVRNGLAEHAIYNAAKGGVHGMTTGFAREFAHLNITVNTVAPCMVMTAAVARGLAAGSERIQQFLDVIPKGRPASTDEVAAMVEYLASPAAAFITGQVISINGGSAML